MIKILYIVTSLDAKSPNNVLFNIISGLDSQKFDITIVTIGSETTNSLSSKFRKIGVDVIHLNLNLLTSFIKFRRLIYKIILIKAPNIIHSQSLRGDFFTSSLRGDFKKICTIHNFINEEYKYSFGLFWGSIFTYVHFLVLKRFDSVVGVSESVSFYLRKKGIENVSYVRNGVDTSLFFEVSDLKKKELRNHLGLPSVKTIILIIGNIDERKNPFIILDCLQYLPRDILKNLLFIYLGTGPLSKQLEDKIGINENIIFLGNVNNVDEYIKASDCYLSTSHSEGYPMAALEAAATNKLLVLSDIEPHREMARIMPKSVIFKNKVELIQILKNLPYYDKDSTEIEDLDNSLGMNAMVNNYVKIYCSLL